MIACYLRSYTFIWIEHINGPSNPWHAYAYVHNSHTLSLLYIKDQRCEDMMTFLIRFYVQGFLYVCVMHVIHTLFMLQIASCKSRKLGQTALKWLTTPYLQSQICHKPSLHDPSHLKIIQRTISHLQLCIFKHKYFPLEKLYQKYCKPNIS